MSTIDELALPRKSMDTSGSSGHRERMPLSGPLGRRTQRRVHSSADVFLSRIAARSTTETFGVGTRIAKPSRRPFSLAALHQPHSPHRSSSESSTWLPRARQVLCGRSRRFCGRCVGVNRRHPTLLDAELLMHNFDGGETVGGAGGVGDDVVPYGIVFLVVDAHHDADVRFLAGAVMMTFFGARFDVFRGAVTIRELAGAFEDHVDTEVLPRQLRGSFTESTLNASPLTVMPSPAASIFPSRLPTESHRKQGASVAALVRSFTATKSMSLSLSAARMMLRPIRLKPLMPTRTAMRTFLARDSTARTNA